MMKKGFAKWMWSLAGVALILSALTMEVHASGPTEVEPTLPVILPIDSEVLEPTKDDFVPWPWGLEMPFPWSFVQGVWNAQKGEFKSYFSFRVVQPAQHGFLRKLEVRQIDPLTCEVLAEGVGFETDRVVRAQMTTVEGLSFRVTLRAFHEKSIPFSLDLKPINNQYMVLSVYPFDAVEPMHMPISLVIGEPNTEVESKCSVQNP